MTTPSNDNDRAPLSDDEMDALAEKLLFKLLSRLAKCEALDVAEPTRASRVADHGQPTANNVRRRVTIARDATAKPTPEDYAAAARCQRRHARKE